MIHLDMVGGLDSREIAVDYIRRFTKADGIISTKTAQIRRAKELGLYTVFRFFLLDSPLGGDDPETVPADLPGLYGDPCRAWPQR